MTDTKRDESRDVWMTPGEVSCGLYGEHSNRYALQPETNRYVPFAHLLAETERADRLEAYALKLVHGIGSVAEYLGQSPSKVSILAALNTLEGLLR